MRLALGEGKKEEVGRSGGEKKEGMIGCHPFEPETTEKINFTENYVVPLKTNPSPDKYTKPSLELTRDRNPNYAISKTHFPRFEYKKMNPSPGPQSYDKDK